MRTITKTKKLLLVLLALSMLSTVGVSSAATEETRALGGFGSVLIYTPTTMSPLGGRSLMIVLHGCTQAISAFRTANLQAAADKRGMVIAVPDAAYKAGFSCWDYWTGTPSRTSKDYKNLISLANTMVADSKYQIDKNQVYIAGLSSGGAFAMNTGCLAPDVFAGMGLVGTPSAGTSSSGAIGVQEGTVQSTRQKCESFAGTNKQHFQTQVTVSAYGTADYTVSKGYGPQNASAMALIYGHSDVSVNANIAKANIKVNTQKTVALVELTGESHAWPGGSGASGSYIGSASINYADYLGEFFNANNRRVATTPEPPACTVPGPAPGKPSGLRADTVADTTADLSVVAVTSSTIVKYKVQVINTGQALGEPAAVVKEGRATFKITGLTPATHYQVQVVAIDNCDQASVASDLISFTTKERIVTYPSASGTATEHYIAGRLTLTQYLEMASKHGYSDPFTLWDVSGTWTDVDPSGSTPPTPVNYTVSTSAGTGGTISPTSRQVTAGAGATFTVTPNSGYSIASVTGCSGTLSGATYTIAAVNANCTVTAQFKQNQVDPPANYTVSTIAGTGGSISPTSRQVTAGAGATFTVTPNSGYSIASVTGCSGTLSGTTYTIAAVNGNCAVTAQFKQVPSNPDPTDPDPDVSGLSGGATSPVLSGALLILWLSRRFFFRRCKHC